MLFLTNFTYSQPDTIVIGFGGYNGVSISSSGNPDDSNPESTINEVGYLPNLNAAARFLSQASLGFNYNDIENVSLMGIEDWIRYQMDSIPMPFELIDKVYEYRQYARDETGNQSLQSTNRMWACSWWQYHMTSNDLLRQRVALALSEIVVISQNSVFDENAFALTDFYDILLNNAFGNYRDILQEVTYSVPMTIYLTYVNNAKTDTTNNQFPDENYAREIMQLFTIGLYELNNDGTRKVDSVGNYIPSYNNDDIIEFAKIFTGLTFPGSNQFPYWSQADTSYIDDAMMWNAYHEPGGKNLLNGFQVPDRNPVDGDADITDALDNLFNHPNVGPFISTLLIQRLVTSNPSAEYIDRVASAFNDNGQGVRGDMKAVIRAILLDPIANSCASGDDPHFGKLKEPFLRYFQLNKAFNASSASGNYRNDMRYIYEFVEQRPLASPSVFNFYQMDYQPLGPINDAELFGPEFQIINSASIAGWIDGLYRFVIDGNIADEHGYYIGEPNENFADEFSGLDISQEITYADDDEELHILIDRLNLLLTNGRLSQASIDKLVAALKQFDNFDEEDAELRARVAIYLVMSSPEYLVNR